MAKRNYQYEKRQKELAKKKKKEEKRLRKLERKEADNLSDPEKVMEGGDVDSETSNSGDTEETEDDLS